MGIVGGIEEEVAETVVRVHNFYFGEVAVAIEGEGVEDDVVCDGGGLVGARKRGFFLVRCDEVLRLGLGNRHFEVVEGLAFPDLGIFGG